MTNSSPGENLLLDIKEQKNPLHGFHLAVVEGLKYTFAALKGKNYNTIVEKPSKPNNYDDKIMTMTTKNNENRTGIYVQESAGVTTAGDGLGPLGDKSPVAQQYDNPINPFKRSLNPLSSIVGGGAAGIESDTNDEKTDRNHSFRIRRFKEMKKEFLKLGFSNQEIRAMQMALEDERRNRHSQNKVIRYCEENNVDLDTIKETWLERKERELAKYRAEKAAKIAAGTFNPIPFRERKRKQNMNKDTYIDRASDRDKNTYMDRDRDRNKSRDMDTYGDRDKDEEVKRSFQQDAIDHLSTEFNIPENKNQNQTVKTKKPKRYAQEMIFISPDIRAGATEYDSPQFLGYRKRTFQLMKERALVRDKNFAEVRRRMGLDGWHKYRDTPPVFRDTPYSPIRLEKKNKNEKQAKRALEARYPFVFEISDKSHPVGEISDENQFLLIDALETTIQDERALGAHWIEIGQMRFRQNRLRVRYKNIHTLKFVQGKIPLYNRLWREADIFVTTEKSFYRRYQYKVMLPQYELTSEEFFKIIKKQNGYPTEYWIFRQKLKWTKAFCGWFSVDAESSRRIQESGCFVHFLFDKIQFRLRVSANGNQSDSD